MRRVGDRFQIIAGERRWRAAKIAGLLRVPVVVRDVAPGQERSLLEMALIENIQREDLNPIEEALAYRRLADEFQLKQEQIADAVGKGSGIGRQLPAAPEAARGPSRGRCGGNAVDGPRARAARAADGSRPATHRARGDRARPFGPRDGIAGQEDRGRRSTPAAPPSPKPVDVHTRAAEERLRLALGTRVRIVRKGTRGRIEIDFGSEEELIRIYEQLTER